MFVDDEDYPAVAIKDYAGQIKNDAGRITVALRNQKETREQLSYVRMVTGFKQRLFWLCPTCRARRLRLYWQSSGWQCRSCLGLRYVTPRLTPAKAAVRAAEQIRAELGGQPNVLMPFPGKADQVTWRRWSLAVIADRRVKERHKRFLLSR